MSLRRLLMAGGVSGPAPVTWNPSDKSSRITLSSGNMVAIHTSPTVEWATVRATLARSTGKFYFEIVSLASSAQDAMFGISDSTILLDGSGGGSANGGFVGSGSAGASYAIYQRDGNKWTASSGSAFSSGWGNGPITLGFAVDLTAGKLWIAKTNVWQASGDPAAGTSPAFSSISGTFFPTASQFNGSSSLNATLKAKSSDLTYTPPTGFSPWDPN